MAQFVVNPTLLRVVRVARVGRILRLVKGLISYEYLNYRHFIKIFLFIKVQKVFEHYFLH
jgi:hypothetical protein